MIELKELDEEVQDLVNTFIKYNAEYELHHDEEGRLDSIKLKYCSGLCGTCWIRYMDGRTVCYGDYGSYIFNRDWGGLQNTPVYDLDYLAEKCDAGKVRRFDCEELEKDLKKTITEDYERDLDDKVDPDDDYSDETIGEAIESCVGDCYEDTYIGEVNNLAYKLDLGDFWYGNSRLGLVYDPQYIAQAAIIAYVLIKEAD